MASRKRKAPRKSKKKALPIVLEPPATRIGDFEVHEAAVLPEVRASEQATLTRSIAEVGLLHPIVRHGGRILGGRSRLEACLTSGVAPHFKDLPDETDPLAYLLATDVERRHLSRSARAITAARSAQLKQGRPKRSVQRCTFTIEQAARRLAVSVRLVKTARKVLDKGVPTLVRAVELDLISVTRAESIVALDAEEQAAFVERLRNAGTAKERVGLVRGAVGQLGLGRTASKPNSTDASLRTLAAHVRSAEVPEATLEEIVGTLAERSGFRLLKELADVVEPVDDVGPEASGVSR